MINDLTDPELAEEFMELVDMLTTLELCYVVNKNNKPNSALKVCAKKLQKRMKRQRSINYLESVVRNYSPVSWLNKQRREISDKCHKWGITYEDYMAIGATLNG